MDVTSNTVLMDIINGYDIIDTMSDTDVQNAFNNIRSQILYDSPMISL